MTKAVQNILLLQLSPFKNGDAVISPEKRGFQTGAGGRSPGPPCARRF